jgi:hypothetical protein
VSVTGQQLRTLKQKYQIAYEAYQSCVKALTEAGLKGNKPSPELLDKEAEALRTLTDARAQLLAAIAAG